MDQKIDSAIGHQRVLTGRKKELETSHPSHALFDLLYSHAGLLRLRDWIIAHGGAGLTREHAAAIACVEAHRFSALFRKCTGQTFLDWRRAYRTACALHALASGQYTVHQVTALVGYRNRRSLERALRDATGRTPADVRNRQRNPSSDGE